MPSKPYLVIKASEIALFELYVSSLDSDAHLENAGGTLLVGSSITLCQPIRVLLCVSIGPKRKFNATCESDFLRHVRHPS